MTASGLSGLPLKLAYHKGYDDIALDFYVPCMSVATSYDRAVGFFSSSIYSLAWPALVDFVRRDGKIRLICSHVLSSPDVDAIQEGYLSRLQDDHASQLLAELDRALADPARAKPTRVLACLISNATVEMRIAFLTPGVEPRAHRIFHDKLGIFKDQEGKTVVFKGSMNESWAGLAADGNLESVDVYASWFEGRERERIGIELDYFDALWNGKHPTAIVQPLPEVARNRLVTVATNADWVALVSEICAEMESLSQTRQSLAGARREPRPHQLQALAEWERQGRRGILEHATGSGKTFTALCAIRKSIPLGEVPLILVPSDELMKQWRKEIGEDLQDLSPHLLLCGVGHDEWRHDGLLRKWTSAGPQPRIVLTTIQTAATSQFRTLVSQGNGLFLIADEVHRLGSPRHRSILELDTGPRLGLSATPRRAGDPDGTQAIFTYFNGVVQPPFTLRDGIVAGLLTPYVYYVHRLELTSSEQDLWNAITGRMGVLYARLQSARSPDEGLRRRLSRLAIARARVVKRAQGKAPLAAQVISSHYQRGQRWLVYCDDLSQLQQVTALLRRNGLDATEYHSAMTADRQATLQHYQSNGGILVSIRCLDEGVDIPDAGHALILASSKNPREFIQRRGRVLRHAPNKVIAHVHDVVVLPGSLSPSHDPLAATPGLSILEGELARAIRFGMDAENPAAITDLQRIALEYGLDYETLLAEGLEDD